MQGTCEILVVGGGPAGLTLAISFVRAGGDPSRIRILEKGRYPREKICAGAVGGRGLAILGALGAKPDVPHVAVDGISLRVRGGESIGVPGTIGWVVRRSEFDAGLAACARSLGITIVEDAKVEQVTFGDDGVHVVSSQGVWSSQMVIGADGVGSCVRRAAGLDAGKIRAQVLEVDTPTTKSDRPRNILHFDAANPALPGYAWDFPTVVNGKPLVCRGVYKLTGKSDVAIDLDAILQERLAAMGLSLADCRKKRFAERGFEWPTRVAGPRWMLVGEAIGIDGVTGEGIAQAIESGDLAGRFLFQCGAQVDDVREWETSFSRSRLFRDMRRRYRILPWFYGLRRREVERYFVESPSAVYVGCQYFAGAPLDGWPLTEAALGLAARAVATTISRALSV